MGGRFDANDPVQRMKLKTCSSLLRKNYGWNEPILAAYKDEHLMRMRRGCIQVCRGILWTACGKCLWDSDRRLDE